MIDNSIGLQIYKKERNKTICRKKAVRCRQSAFNFHFNFYRYFLFNFLQLFLFITLVEA